MTVVVSEATSLAVHVARCEERYTNLEMRILRLEKVIYWSTALMLTGMGGMLAKVMILV